MKKLNIEEKEIHAKRIEAESMSLLIFGKMLKKLAQKVKDMATLQKEIDNAKKLEDLVDSR